jgi:hypothetical protein
MSISIPHESHRPRAAGAAGRRFQVDSLTSLPTHPTSLRFSMHSAVVGRVLCVAVPLCCTKEPSIMSWALISDQGRSPTCKVQSMVNGSRKLAGDVMLYAGSNDAGTAPMCFIPLRFLRKGSKQQPLTQSSRCFVIFVWVDKIWRVNISVCSTTGSLFEPATPFVHWCSNCKCSCAYSAQDKQH